jgi:hypothetical protein
MTVGRLRTGERRGRHAGGAERRWQRVLGGLHEPGAAVHHDACADVHGDPGAGVHGNACGNLKPEVVAPRNPA